MGERALARACAMALPQVAVAVLVPGEGIARVIGKAGAGLKQVREATGCKVHVQADQQGPSRRVDLAGHLEGLCVAFGLVLQKALEQPMASISLQCFVAADKAGQIVGKGGEGLRRVRETCQVHVKLEREPIVDPNTGSQERLMTMHGDFANMVTALRCCLGGPSSSAAATGMPPLAGLPAMLPGAGMVAGPPPATACLSHVRPPSANPEDMQVHVQVADRFAGAILGRAGAEIKQTAATAGCSVCLTNRSESVGDRRAVIVGNYSQCAMAQAILHEQMAKVLQEDPGQQSDPSSTEASVIYLIQKVAVGGVIGRAGAGLKTIREQCGVQVHVDREEMQGHRLCRITGMFPAVLQAEKMIYDLSFEAVGKNAANGGGMPNVLAQAQFPLPAANRLDFPAAFAAGVPAAKRQRIDEGGSGGEGATKLLIPSTSAGAIIGKQGNGLKHIRESCGVKVDMSDKMPPHQYPNDRVVCLLGPLPARQAATAAVLHTAFPPELAAGVCALRLLVPDAAAGGIIGRQGQTLKLIREHTGVSVAVDKDGSSGERLVTADGPLAQVAAAAAMVLGIMDQSSSGGGQWSGAAAPTHAHNMPGPAAIPSGGGFPPQHVPQYVMPPGPTAAPVPAYLGYGALPAVPTQAGWYR